jgi:hypothetical protein
MTVEEWLLDSDPAIRWQVMHDVTDEPADVVAGALRWAEASCQPSMASRARSAGRV